ncbi:MAG: molecular chaperone DnaK, partial [Oscillatoriales cyanobacterium]
KERREKIDRKNQADQLAYQAEKQMTELGDKVPAAEKTKVDELVANLREAIRTEDDEKITTLTTELQQTLYAIGSSVYQQGGDGGGDGGSTPPGGGSTGGSSGGDDVIDAEFSETK